jgi:hypothetical protein
MPISGAIGTAVYEPSSRELAAEAATSHRVTATAAHSSVRTVPFNTGPLKVLAHWQLDGHEHIGRLQWSRPEVSAGDQMEIRVNSDGERAAPPSWPAFHAVAVGLGIWLSFAVGAVTVFAVMWQRLHHVRLAGWDRELTSLTSDDGRGRANR